MTQKYLVATAAALTILTACTQSPARSPLPESPPTAASPSASTSTPPASSPTAIAPSTPAVPPGPAAQPDPKAAQNVPDVGQLPAGFKLPRTSYQVSRIEAITFCKLTWYPGLAQRQASRFRMSVSETYESGGADGVLVMTSEASAQQLMAEIRAAAQGCLTNGGFKAKSLSTPQAGPWQETVALAYEQLKNGKNRDDAYGTAVYVVRKGRVIVATTDWTMYAHPVTDTPFPADPALDRLAAMLKAAQA